MHTFYGSRKAGCLKKSYSCEPKKGDLGGLAKRLWQTAEFSDRPRVRWATEIGLLDYRVVAAPQPSQTERLTINS